MRNNDIKTIYRMKSEAWAEIKDAEEGEKVYGVDCQNRYNYWSGRHRALSLVCEMIERPSLLTRIRRVICSYF